MLVSWFPQRWQRILGGVIAAMIGATAFTVWNQSVVNEKVYTVSLVGIALISWLMIRWSDEPDGRKADRILVLARGRLIADGNAAAIRDNPQVREVYFGTGKTFAGAAP